MEMCPHLEDLHNSENQEFPDGEFNDKTIEKRSRVHSLGFRDHITTNL